MIKTSELRQKPAAELTKLLAQERQNLADLVVDYKTKDVANPRQIRGVKKQIARLLTLLKEQTLAEDN